MAGADRDRSVPQTDQVVVQRGEWVKSRGDMERAVASSSPATDSGAPQRVQICDGAVPLPALPLPPKLRSGLPGSVLAWSRRPTLFGLRIALVAECVC